MSNNTTFEQRLERGKGVTLTVSEEITGPEGGMKLASSVLPLYWILSLKSIDTV